MKDLIEKLKEQVGAIKKKDYEKAPYPSNEKMKHDMNCFLASGETLEDLFSKPLRPWLSLTIPEVQQIIEALEELYILKHGPDEDLGNFYKEK